MSLLSNAAFKATQGEAPFKYLGVISDSSGENNGYLEYSTDAVLSKNAKFNIENAGNGLVHIRSYFTNKYWVRSSTNGNWIVALGLEPEDDPTSWTCTLFGMVIDDDKNTKFYHVQSGNMVHIPNDGSGRKMFLTIDPAATTVAVSLAIDYDEFVILPKYIAFRGSNGKLYQNYCERGPDNDGYAEFSVTDIGDPNIVCEPHYSNDGLLRVKAANSSGNMFWNYNYEEGMITWDRDTPEDPRQMFSVIRIDDNKVALRSLITNKLLQRADVEHSDGKKDRLVAKGNGAIADTHLEVVEPVLRRTVFSVEFDLDKARTYGITLLYTDEHIWRNFSDQTQSGTADGRISTSKSTSFSNSINISGTVKTTIEAGIPLLVKGEVEVSATAGYTHEWNTTETEEQQVGHVFEVVVLPRKKTIARGTATKGFCDVPFSYVQRDYPANGGPPIITKLYDGVFKGANAYGFDSEVRYEDLPPEDLFSNKRHVEFITIPAKAPTPVTKTPTGN